MEAHNGKCIGKYILHHKLRRACRSSQRLNFHFNASLIALNVAKYEAYTCHLSPAPFVFSIASYKRREFNRHLLYTFIDKLDLDHDLILNHPNLPSVLSYGTLAA